MKLVLVSWLVISATAFTKADQTAAIKRSEALYGESIPHLQLQGASLEEALKIIREKWEQKHPSEPFPVGITEIDTERPLITVDEKTQLGIYEVDGDTFRSCFGKPGAERPTDFTSKPGDGRTLSVWKREKPAAFAPENK